MSHIVVVEDSPTQAAVIDMVLVSAGHTVRHFPEASGLIDECLVSAPDLLIVDLNLGEGTGGLELCRQFKANLSLQTLPLLVLTSSTASEDRLRAMEAGADRFLTRDSEAAQVLATVDSLVRTSLPVRTIEADSRNDHDFVRGSRMLVVDDSPTWHKLIVPELQAAGFQTETAESLGRLWRLFGLLPESRRRSSLPTISASPDRRAIDLSSAAFVVPAPLRSAVTTKAFAVSSMQSLSGNIQGHDNALYNSGYFRRRGLMSGPSKSKPVEILLVEDDLADIELTRQGFLDGKVANILHVARDGFEALEMLRGEGGVAEPIRPDLILLDLNMPRMDGRQFLARMKADDSLMDTVVVILTTSVSDRDLVQTFDLHPDAYLNKPVDFDGLIEVVQSIWDFWFMVVRKTSAGN